MSSNVQFHHACLLFTKQMLIHPVSSSWLYPYFGIFVFIPNNQSLDSLIRHYLGLQPIFSIGKVHIIRASFAHVYLFLAVIAEQAMKDIIL